MRQGLMIFGRIVLVVLMLAAAPAVFAQEDLDYSWGTVIEVSGDKVVLEEYDFETDDYIQVSYKVAQDAEIENAETLADVLPGDEVEVGFLMSGEERMIQNLYVEKDSSSEEE